MQDITNEEIKRAFQYIDFSQMDKRMASNIAYQQAIRETYNKISQLITTKYSNNNPQNIDYIVMFFQEKEQRQVLEDAYRNAIERSKNKEQVDFRREKKNAQNQFVKFIAGFSAVLVIGCGSSKILFPMDKETKIEKEPIKVEQTVHYSSNNTTEVTFSDKEIEKMAKDLLELEGNYDYDYLIYKCFQELFRNPLKVESYMNTLFNYIHQYIEENIDGYSQQIVAALNYSTFNEYIASRGFKSIYEYRQVMGNQNIEYATLANESGGR